MNPLATMQNAVDDNVAFHVSGWRINRLIDFQLRCCVVVSYLGLNLLQVDKIRSSYWIVMSLNSIRFFIQLKKLTFSHKFIEKIVGPFVNGH